MLTHELAWSYDGVRQAGFCRCFETVYFRGVSFGPDRQSARRHSDCHWCSKGTESLLSQNLFDGPVGDV